MSLIRIVMRLARNPGYPDGDREHGYVLTAPLTSDGWLDPAEWREERERCTVVRFKPGDDKDADGKLTHRGEKWFFHYDEAEEGDDEPVFRLGDHRLAVGDYVTIHEADGDDLTYRVDQHIPAPARAVSGS